MYNFLFDTCGYRSSRYTRLDNSLAYLWGSIFSFEFPRTAHALQFETRIIDCTNESLRKAASMVAEGHPAVVLFLYSVACHNCPISVVRLRTSRGAATCALHHWGSVEAKIQIEWVNRLRLELAAGNSEDSKLSMTEVSSHSWMSAAEENVDQAVGSLLPHLPEIYCQASSEAFPNTPTSNPQRQESKKSTSRSGGRSRAEHTSAQHLFSKAVQEFCRACPTLVDAGLPLSESLACDCVAAVAVCRSTLQKLDSSKAFAREQRLLHRHSSIDVESAIEVPSIRQLVAVPGSRRRLARALLSLQLNEAHPDLVLCFGFLERKYDISLSEEDRNAVQVCWEI